MNRVLILLLLVSFTGCKAPNVSLPALTHPNPESSPQPETSQNLQTTEKSSEGVPDVNEEETFATPTVAPNPSPLPSPAPLRAMDNSVPNYVYYELENYSDIFAKENIFTGRERTWDEFFGSVQRAYEEHGSYLSNQWNIKGNRFKAMFLMNVVSSLWGLGDIPGPDGIAYSPSCVDNNRFITSEKAIAIPGNPFLYLSKLSPQVYLRSKVACCNDYAMILYMMLNYFHIPARHVGFPGHIYVQATIDGAPMIMDAMINFAVDLDNKQFVRQGTSQPTTYYVFPYWMSDPKSGDNYRPKAAQIRADYLRTEGRTIISRPVSYPWWDKFDLWMRLGYVDEGKVQSYQPGEK